MRYPPSQKYQPFQEVALRAPDPRRAAVPLLQDRHLVDGQAAAYACRNLTCQTLITEPEGLRDLPEGD